MNMILFIVFMACLASLAGGSFPGSQRLDKYKITWLPELVFAIPFGFALEKVAGVDGPSLIGAVLYLLGTAWAFGWFQSGHGVVLPWGDEKAPSNPGRKQTLTPFVDWLAHRMKIVKFKPNGTHCTVEYCRLFMAVKGFLLGLPTGPGAFLLALLWPLAYEIGARFRYRVKFDANIINELLSGVFAAVVILMVFAGTTEIMVNQ